MKDQKALVKISVTIQVRRTRRAGHCWRSRGELIRDVLLWTPTYGRAKAGRPKKARTYMQQLCEDTGCSFEDLPEAMDDREKWRERVRDIRASGTTSWSWWFYQLQLKTKALVRKFERIVIKFYKKNVSLLFNQTCPYIYIYMCVCVYVCVCLPTLRSRAGCDTRSILSDVR